MTTALRQLVEYRLGTDLAVWVQDRRDAGAGWRPIARELSEVTGTPVTYESLRTWHTDGVAA